MIGGSGEKVTLRLVAEHAQMWHGFLDPEAYAHKSEVLAGHCERIGRDPATVQRVIGAGIEHADATRRRGRRRADDRRRRRPLGI